MKPDADSRPGLVIVFRPGDHNVKPIIDGAERLAGEGSLRSVAWHAVDPNSTDQEQGDAWERIIRMARSGGAEFVLLQHFHHPRLRDPRSSLGRLRSLPSNPLIGLSNGDPHFNGWFFRPAFPGMFYQAAEMADVVFTTSMGRSADHLFRKTGARISLLPFGACQVRFGQLPQQRSAAPRFRVGFVGSNNRSRVPLKAYHWYGRRREMLIRRLRKRFGDAVGVFGRGWEGVDGWQGPVPFDEQLDACRSAEIVVGGVSFSSARYYASDRPFNQIMSGVPFVDLAVEGVQLLLRDGEHWHLGHTLDEVVDRCDELISRPASEREEMGMEAAKFVASEHMGENRVRSMMATLERIRHARDGGPGPRAPDLRFFLPEIDPVEELPLATRGWSDAAMP